MAVERSGDGACTLLSSSEPTVRVQRAAGGAEGGEKGERKGRGRRATRPPPTHPPAHPPPCARDDGQGVDCQELQRAQRAHQRPTVHYPAQSLETGESGHHKAGPAFVEADMFHLSAQRRRAGAAECQQGRVAAEQGRNRAQSPKVKAGHCAAGSAGRGGCRRQEQVVGLAWKLNLGYKPGLLRSAVAALLCALQWHASSNRAGCARQHANACNAASSVQAVAFQQRSHHPHVGVQLSGAVEQLRDQGIYEYDRCRHHQARQPGREATQTAARRQRSVCLSN